MTNLEALKAAVLFPLDDNTAIKALLDNGIVSSDPYAGKSQPFDLATADTIVSVVTAASIAEGDYSLSVTAKESLVKIASGIYRKYGKPDPLNPRPVIRDASNRW